MPKITLPTQQHLSHQPGSVARLSWQLPFVVWSDMKLLFNKQALIMLWF